MLACKPARVDDSAMSIMRFFGPNPLKDALVRITLDQKVIQLERQVEIKKHPVAQRNAIDERSFRIAR